MHSRIEQQVMASVAVIHAGRRLTSRIALECYALAAAAVALWQLTWVHKVAANFYYVIERGGLSAADTYVTYALTHTHAATLLALLVAAAAGIAFMVDAVRALSHPAYRPA